jgi:acetyl esterase/lipase
MTDPRVLRDVVYSELLGFRPLTLDIHSPASDDTASIDASPDALAPVILFLHGGGWRAGSKASFGPHLTTAQSFTTITDAGFAVVSADYRLSGEARFPAQVDDVRAALAWVGEAGADYGLDASRIILWGESAGATLAALVALEPGPALGNAEVLGVIDWYGPSDLVAMSAGLTPAEAAVTRETGWLGVSALDDPERAASASPLNKVHAGAPPFHVEHGDSDDAVPQAQSTAFVAALEAAGVPVTFVSVPGANHMWGGVANPAPIVERALDFARALIGR